MTGLQKFMHDDDNNLLLSIEHAWSRMCVWSVILNRPLGVVGRMSILAFVTQNAWFWSMCGVNLAAKKQRKETVGVTCWSQPTLELWIWWFLFRWINRRQAEMTNINCYTSCACFPGVQQIETLEWTDQEKKASLGHSKWEYSFPSSVRPSQILPLHLAIIFITYLNITILCMTSSITNLCTWPYTWTSQTC